jgi:hypothetical protein
MEYETDNPIGKYINAVLILEFSLEKAKGGLQWQSEMWDGDMKVVFVVDRKFPQAGVVGPKRKKWSCMTTRSMYNSKDEKFYLVGVALISPVDD